MTFHLNGLDIREIHHKHVHTDVDSVIHFTNANVIHTRDIFFNGRYPFIDTNSEESVQGVIKAVKQIIKMADHHTKIIPGHGKLGNKKDLQNYLDMLLTVTDRMQRLIKEGKSLDEIKALKPNADYDDSYGSGFISAEKFLGILYDGLIKKD